ncbi:MAG: DNA-binding protein WhiA [Actinomycetota bacterium]|nr:DNA-binding protein WhiA [Actinomycetota bacterium]
MLSFASEIKRQLASRTSSATRRTNRHELVGLMDAAGEWDGSGVTFTTRNAAVARSVVRLLRSEFGLHSRLSPAGTDRFGRARYAVHAEGNGAIQAKEELRAARSGLRGAAEGTAYLRGAFQGAGSVSRPGRGYHLEIFHRDEAFVRRVATLSRAPLGVTRRRGRWVAYARSADSVTTFLSQLGLHDAVLEYEARAVLGEAKANANRLTNFDAANAGRTAVAAARQQEVLETLDPDSLPPALREMLELRLEHSDASLADLARLGNLSKSAVNHRLRRLIELSGKLTSR